MLEEFKCPQLKHYNVQEDEMDTIQIIISLRLRMYVKVSQLSCKSGNLPILQTVLWFRLLKASYVILVY